MEQILSAYYADNAKKLHKVVDKILQRYGGLAEKDRDDFYSLANEVFVGVMRRYDASQSFEAFLYACLQNKIKTEMTRRNREKRRADRMSISIDMPVGDEEDLTVGDLLVDNRTIEMEVFDSCEEEYSRRMLRYLGRLSSLQKEVLRLNMAGYPSDEIRKELHISEKQYADCQAAIHSYRNVSVLF